MAADRSTRIVLGMAGFSAIVTAWAGPGAPALLTIGVALGVIGLRIIRQDLATFTIPDAGTLAFAIVAIGSRWSEAVRDGDAAGPALALATLDAAICGGALLTVREIHYRRRGHDGIGFGDVKLAAAGGILVGTTGFAWSVLGASLVGLAIAFRNRMSVLGEGPSRALSAGAEAGSARVDPAGGCPDALVQPQGTGERIAFGALLVPALWLTWLLGRGGV